MKKLVFAAVIFLVSAYHTEAQVKPTEKQQLVQKVITDAFQALADRNAEGLRSHCTPGFLLLENGSIWNIDSLTQRIDQNKAVTDFKRINTLDFINTKVSNNTAWTTYNNQAEVTKNGQRRVIRWLETAILIKEGNTWKIEVLHSTVIK